MLGQLIGKYRILKRLGAGGMGIVYRAQDERLKRHVAIKLLPPAMALDSAARARLEREAQSISVLDHPNICTIHEIGEHDGQLFIVMACYDGQTLRQLMDRGPLLRQQAAHIGAQIARALERAHEAGIIHRDVKPANVMVTTRGDVKLLDFGLAKGRDALNLTADGALAGTPAYMSPEQVEGRAVDQRADVWALGVMVYEMFAGQPPFRGNSVGALMRCILHDEPEPLLRECPGISSALDEAVRRTLTKDLEARVPDVSELRAALEGSQQADIQTLAPPGSVAGGRQSAPARAAEGSTGAQLKSVAVLPFANRSPDPDQAYFCEGLTDELITGLTRLNRFRVASRNAAVRPGESTDAAAIGRLLNVDAVLEGSVRRAGQQLRVSVQLVDVPTGFVAWSDRYDGELQDVFRMQEEITARVVQGLSGVFGPEDRARLAAGTTQSLEAYEYYLRGRMLARQGRRAPLEEAIRMYERAIEIDANYALAYAGLASARTWLYTYWGGDSANARDAHRAARKAVELAPNLAEAHAVLGSCPSIDGGHEAAERAFEEALRLNSNSPWVLQAYADHLFRQGEMERAAEYYKKALALDPERHEVRGTPLALILKRLGRHDEFLTYVRRSFELSVREAAVNPGDARAVYLAGLSLLRLGETREGLQWIDRALAIDSEDPLLLYNVACAFALAGETERALATLEKTVANGLSNLTWLENDNDFDSIRDHPRFSAIVDRLRRNTTSS